MCYTFFDENLNLKGGQLSKEESLHCTQVLRSTIGDFIHLVNGKGLLANAKIISIKNKMCFYEIVNYRREAPPTKKIHLAIAPTKNGVKMEWLVEKLTEIGIAEISFFKSQHSERKEFKLDRIYKKMTSALKQSKNPFAPILYEMVSFQDFVKKMSNRPINKFIAYFDEQNISLQKEALQYNESVVLIGPEGDFSLEEKETALQNLFIPINLSSTILRTETAGLVACANIKILSEN